MGNISIESVNDFLIKEGEELGTSQWMLIDQTMINCFAAVTKDNQWIHIAEERVKKESPYHSTIAHGYLTLSLVIHLLDSVYDVKNILQVVNYGVEKLIFHTPVLVGNRVRIHVRLKSVKDLGNVALIKLACRMEIEGQEKIAFDGVISLLYYFRIS